MEINNFIIFIIIILLSIILYKSAKIFNYNKKENFSTVIGTRDNTGLWNQSLNEYDQLIEDCKGEWTKCSSDTNNECKRTYRISNPGYTGVSDTCIGSDGEPQKCTPDLDDCISYTEYTINGVNFDILKNTTIRHKKRYNINGSAAIQNKEDISEKVSNVSSEPNIENEQFERLMTQYTGGVGSVSELGSLSIDSNSDEFIGIILERNNDNTTNFYPIFINNDSQIETVKKGDSTVFIKKNIDCKGKWSPCTFKFSEDIGSQVSEKTYFVNYYGTGTGYEKCSDGNSDSNRDGDTILCANWSDCELINNENKRTWITQAICNEEGEDCMKTGLSDGIQSPTTDGCETHIQCTIDLKGKDDGCATFMGGSGDKGHPDIEVGDSGKIAEIINSDSSLGSNIKSCKGYEDGKFYRSLMKLGSNSLYEPADCDPSDSLKRQNCTCNIEDEHAIECTKNYRIYWGRDWYDNEKKEPKGFSYLPGNMLDPTNETHMKREDGNCWLQIYNYKPSTTKWKEQNPQYEDKNYCPAYIDLYDDNGVKLIDKRIVSNEDFPSSNSKIGKQNISSGMIVDLIQEAKNYDETDNNQLNKGITKNEFIKFERRNTPSDYPVANGLENQGSNSENYWGEICKNIGPGVYGGRDDIRENIDISPVNCSTTERDEPHCGNNYDGQKTYKDIVTNKSFGGICSIDSSNVYLRNNCTRKPPPPKNLSFGQKMSRGARKVFSGW
tara:strand:- start:395 stop:2566 length:2172 start_codon:yes stop_codon:yes gene_type:complete